MRITELFTAQSIALDEALQTQEEILSRLVELQATHGNITDKDAYKKALYAREAEGSTYVDNGITVPHAKTNVVTRPSLAALRLSSPVQYNAEDDGTTDLLFAIAAPENGSLHVDMLARMMQMLMNEDFVAKLKAAKTPAEFLDCIDAQEVVIIFTESTFKLFDQLIPKIRTYLDSGVQQFCVLFWIRTKFFFPESNGVFFKLFFKGDVLRIKNIKIVIHLVIFLG